MRWLAPEYIFSSTTPVMNHTSRDIYAFGCTIVEILTQKLPFYDHKTDALVMFNLMNGGRPTRPQGVWCPDVAWNLITRCWTQDAQDRPLASEIHEILQSVLESVSPTEPNDSPSLLAEIAAELPLLGIDASLWDGQPKANELKPKMKVGDEYYAHHVKLSVPHSVPSTLTSKKLPPIPNHLPSHPPSPIIPSTSPTGLSTSSITGSSGAGSIVQESSDHSFGISSDSQLPSITTKLPSHQSWIPKRDYVPPFQVVVLGAGGVGKTALIAQFVPGVTPRDHDYDPTIEGTYLGTITVDGESSVLEVVDLSGLEEYRRYNEPYIKTGKGFVLVFSLTQETSLEEVDQLRKDIIRIKGVSSDSIPIVVVGTKSDLVSERAVHENTIQSLSSQWWLPFYETSAMLNLHVSEVFEHLVRQMRGPYPTARRPIPEKTHTQKKKGPCLIM
ncbi:hypothetical protein GYMLUDRAFT_485395 [Collybiopsis luxurians FD-317 M1]|uniref:Protein kinase domain-containing protein n=1 Tax=Collybiopsis luxurians FD-317 M1 TaxID=944289 RepID=A0A0D0CUI8_9AGAR|nr:hypothetical protein GYMLUDRAFT_485395 [Collybiopsis luxurians FD-317 M1]